MVVKECSHNDSQGGTGTECSPGVLQVCSRCALTACARCSNQLSIPEFDPAVPVITVPVCLDSKSIDSRSDLVHDRNIVNHEI